MHHRILSRLSAAYVLAAVAAPGAADNPPVIPLVSRVKVRQVTGISAHTPTAYNVVPIPLPPGSAFSIAGINDAGQVAGTTVDASRNPLWNFLYTPGPGANIGTLSNIERTSGPSSATWEGSNVEAINGSGQILLASGLLYTPGRPPQNLAPAVAAAFPTETRITFTGLNDAGAVSGISEHPDDSGASYTEHIFRYDPRSSSGVVSVAFTNNRRTFPAGPYLIDDSGDVVYSTGFIPFGATIFTGAGVTIGTGCGLGNGQAFAINNSRQIGGGWGAHTESPEICSFDPVQSSWKTTPFTDESTNTAGDVASLNDFGDGVGWIGSARTPTLFTHDGRAIDVNSLTIFSSGSRFTATTVSHINDAGEIAGVGTFDGVPTAYVLSPVPPPSYSLQTLCTGTCFGDALSNSGFVVWSQDQQFLVSSPRNGTFVVPGMGNIQQINTRGDVVGQDLLGRAIVSAPPYTQLDNLNTVFGVDKGIASSINDGGDIVGDGGRLMFDPALASLPSPSLLQINNARQLTGSYEDLGGLHFFLYTPGAGIVDLPGFPQRLSNTGHVLLLMSAYTEQYTLWKPDGVFPLPLGVQWNALNDRDELVGHQIIPGISRSAVFYSINRGLFLLGPLLLGYGYTQSEAEALNNAGQILVTATSADSGVSSAVLLNPDN